MCQRMVLFELGNIKIRRPTPASQNVAPGYYVPLHSATLPDLGRVKERKRRIFAQAASKFPLDSSSGLLL